MCFSLAWIEQLCVWLIVVAALVAVINLLVPYLTGLIGLPIVAQIIKIVLWGLLGSGGGLLHFPTR